MTTNVKIVVLGDGGVGKTALTLRLSLNFFVETYDPTIEDSYRKQAIIDEQPYMLEILDTAGQEEYTALRDQWIREGEAFLIVYSVTSRASFDRVEKFRTQVARVKDSDAVPVVLVGNKIDRVHEREVETKHGEQLAQRLGCAFVETSAKTRENLEEAFFTAVRMVERQKGGSAAKPLSTDSPSPRSLAT
ncbi:Ras GTPase ras2 [Rhodotorula mucilaginosa]|uniref:Ras GTPase ras2 n=1 Tax=Rhodotorula mucilaginosa TaxID=5537 RepID=A0A9P6W6H4_RHOMI|nr:Ras GTPase ras2 [Rhodotorula mucilaginosa]